MKAICFDGNEATVRDDLPQPAPADGEVLIRMRKAGVCRTDLEILKGYMGFTGVVGHEFVGEVVEGPANLMGRRVVGEINCLAKMPSPSLSQRERGKSSDPHPASSRGREVSPAVGSDETPPPPGEVASPRAGGGNGVPKNHDPARTVLGIAGRDGCFANYLTLPAENLHLVPDTVDDDAAVFVEPLAAACRILEQVEVKADDRVAVFGDGRLGLLCGFVLATRAEHVLQVGRHSDKLALAGKRGLATALADDLDAGEPFDIVVDATGKADGFTAAMAAVRPLGTLVLKSTVAAETGMNLAPLVINEINVVGSRCGPFDAAIDMLAEGLIDPRDLITGRFPLSRGVEALHAAAGENIKVLIDAD